MDLKSALEATKGEGDDSGDEPKFDADKAFGMACKMAMSAMKTDSMPKFQLAMKAMMKAYDMMEDSEEDDDEGGEKPMT